MIIFERKYIISIYIKFLSYINACGLSTLEVPYN